MRFIGFTILTMLLLVSSVRAEVVGILFDGGAGGGGHGVAIHRRYVLSCEHCARGNVTLYTSQGIVRGEVMYADPDRDLALIRIHGADAQVTPLCPRFGRSKFSTAVQSVTLKRTESGDITSEDTKYFYATVRIQPGDSGSALLDEQGRLLGIAVAIDASGNGRFIHHDEIHDFLFFHFPEYQYEKSEQHPASTGFCFLWIVFGVFILWASFKKGR